MQIDDSRALWLIVTVMLIAVWLLIPLGSFYRYLQGQHCLQTFARVSQTSVVQIEQLEREARPRSGDFYRILLTADDATFRFAYEGQDGLGDESNYNIRALHNLLEPLAEQQALVEVRWVRSGPLFGRERLMTHIAGERVPASCAWGWLLWYGPLFLFFAGFTWLGVFSVKTAVSTVDQNPDISQEALISRVISRWAAALQKWLDK